ncbi:MAG: M20/M25/M40 family metallo-hydrolase, partial [Rickettsiales bacterium]|nr:M20/M25/M40 family metallo-hydrolase [Rickettsiales bacterium]
MLDLIARLVSIPSVTGNFEAIDTCFCVCRDFLCRSPGIHTEEIIRNGYKTIIFSNSNDGSLKFDVVSPCHIDVVPADSYKLTRDTDAGKIFGRGVFDMKSFIASSLINLKSISSEGRKIKYAAVITSDEEIGGNNGLGYLVNTLALESRIVLDSD